VYEIYDIETYPNCFTSTHYNVQTGKCVTFEISGRRNDLWDLIAHLRGLVLTNTYLVGFNNVHFDWPVLSRVLQNDTIGVSELYVRAQAIIDSDNSYEFVDWEPQVSQIDLYKIHHFDNQAKRTSLKSLEINMMMQSIQDMPIAPGTTLSFEQMDELREYNQHDVLATSIFFEYSRPQIEFRLSLGKHTLNSNDTKIGKDYFIKRLELEKPYKQSPRDSIPLGDVIFSYIDFATPDLKRMLEYLKTIEIVGTKDSFKPLTPTIGNLTVTIRQGGIHGSVSSETIRATDTHAIIDIDVASYYPSLSISNDLYPGHLGHRFCDIYREAKKNRQSYDKKDPRNGMLKLALNGVGGDSGSPYSPFYDPQYTMSITINGQLLLCKLAEILTMHIADLRLLQINTDGMTVLVNRNDLTRMREMMRQWERWARGLELEEVEYSSMFIRDVNNYTAVKVSGGVKRIGEFCHETARENPATREVLWYKDHSALVIPKAVEAYLLRGVDPVKFITNHTQGFDFMLKAKVPKNSYLLLGGDKIQNTSRYYVSKVGDQLTKVSPPTTGYEIGWFKKANGVSECDYFSVSPTDHDPRYHTKNKSKYTQRSTDFEAGWFVSLCNDAQDFNPLNINIEYYAKRAWTLINNVNPHQSHQ